MAQFCHTFDQQKLKTIIMIINNLRLTIRHLSRQKINTALHIVGLTLGMSVCLLIGLFLRYELSFDTYHEKADRTYRINLAWTDVSNKQFHYSTPMPLAEAVREGISGIENVSLAHPHHDIVEINPQKRFMQEHILIVDPEFLDIFDIEVLKGNGYKALHQPYQALLTESTARKFFGKEDPIGKTFKYRNDFDITVSALIRDLPSNTHLPASMLLSYVPEEAFMAGRPNAWSSTSGTSTYVVLQENQDLKNFEAQLKQIADNNINSIPTLPKNMRCDFYIQLLRDVHFDSKYRGGSLWVKAVNPSWLWFFGIIGVAVLALACINFINLSTAQALARAKEVGVRKSVGAGRFHLITQFLGEAWLLTFISGLLAVVIAQASLPAMNTLLEKKINLNLLYSPGILLALFAGILLTGLMAGLYPAWVIAKFNPVTALKTGSTIQGDSSSSWLRKGLVVMQFTISVGLLIAVTLISQQVNYLRSKNLGFDKDNIIDVEITNSSKAEILATTLAEMPQIKQVSFATATPSSDNHWGTHMSKTDVNDPERTGVTLILADAEYCKMYGLQLINGRFLEESDTNYTSRSISEEDRVNKVVVNEKLVQVAGFESNEAAVGKRFWFGMGSEKAEIVGVISDFNTTSLHEAINPTLITQHPEFYSQAGIKIEANSNIPQTIAAIETAWKEIFPDGIFEFKFLDEQIDASYKSETKLYNLFRIFSGLAMLISCLGLWGLAFFAAQQRTKEIGIRKVLGASANAIVILLTKDFLLMVTIALAIASPLVYYLIRDWLQTFAYRIDVNWHVFVIAGATSVAIALITVSVQTLKAALANPVDSLRSE